MTAGGKRKADEAVGAGDERQVDDLPVTGRVDVDSSAGGEPQTLGELLAALERSDNLRSLARECGLTVRELRRRLAVWRREMATDEGPEMGHAPAPGRAGRAGNPARGAASGAPSGAPSGHAAAVADGAQAGGLVEAALALVPAVTLHESPLPLEGSQVLEAWTDGASRGNPGPAAIGIVFRQQGGPLLCGHAETIGHSTNNHAEYRAVLRALELARGWGIARLDLYLDSELIARQLTGVYRVKSLELRPLNQQILFLAKELRAFRVRHVTREKNRLADQLCNLALDGKWPPRDSCR